MTKLDINIPFWYNYVHAYLSGFTVCIYLPASAVFFLFTPLSCQTIHLTYQRHLGILDRTGRKVGDWAAPNAYNPLPTYIWLFD